MRHDPQDGGSAPRGIHEHPVRQGPDDHHDGEHLVRLSQILRFKQQHGAAHLTGRSEGSAAVLPRSAQVPGDEIRRARGR